MPKSSQAARNSCLSAARSSASRRRQAGSILKKENLANVRSAIAVTIAAVVLLVAAAPASARVTLVLLPQGTSVDELAAAGMSPGLMSAGLGLVPAEQTYLDIGQGNRVFDSLYDSDLPRATVPLNRPVTDPALLRRAESAPAEIVPGLLARTLARAGQGFEVRDAPLAQLRRLVARLRGDDLLIAIERPPPEKNRGWRSGSPARGFDGNLTSDSTRLDGYVLSTDVAPTILERLGVAVPAQMSGQPIRAEGEVDPAAVVALGDRMAVISERRGPVIGLSLLAWVLALGLVAGLAGGAAARTAVRVVGLAVVYVPLVLLVGAAIEPGETAEMLLVMLGAPGAGGADAGAVRRLPGAGGGLGADGARLRGRHDRRLAADRALADGPQSRAGGSLLRDRQRARGAAGGAGRRRHRGGADRVRATPGAPPAPPRPSSPSASAPPSSSRPGASAPTSARRS